MCPIHRNVANCEGRYNGLAIYWEHRFYGESLPFPQNEDGYIEAGYSAYKYLTTEQALEDVVYLSQHFEPPGLEDYWSALRAAKTPWIFVGGSYSGVRAAFMRIRNPETIYASWSSSAPVQATVNWFADTEWIYKDLTANCSADIQAASRYLDTVFDSGDEDAIMKAKSWTKYPEAPVPRNTNVNELTDEQITNLEQFGADLNKFEAAQNLVADQSFLGQDFVSFGFDLVALPICNYLEQTDPTTIDTTSTRSLLRSGYDQQYQVEPSEDGIAATYGDEAAFYALVFALSRNELDKLDTQKRSTFTMPAAQSFVTFSWKWQTCSEYGIL